MSKRNWTEASEATEERLDIDNAFKRPCYQMSHHWSADPEESFSDWMIEVATADTSSSSIQHDDPHQEEMKETKDEEPKESNVKETTEAKKYYVHKMMVASGPKQCEYFRRLFKHDSFAESQSSSSRIKLSKMAAEAFPVFLDYLYSPSHELAISTENATALYFLGDYFECDGLLWEASQFLKGDLSINTCHVYYEHAIILKVDRIAETVAELCSNKISEIPVDSPLLTVLDTHLWIKILQDTPGRESIHKSRLVAALCSIKDVDSSSFQILTAEDVLPVIDFSVSQKLIELEAQIENPKGGTSNLQARCANSLVGNWTQLDTEDNAGEFFSRRTPEFLTAMLLSIVDNAKKQRKEMMKSTKSLQKRLSFVSTELETCRLYLEPSAVLVSTSNSLGVRLLGRHCSFSGLYKKISSAGESCRYEKQFDFDGQRKTFVIEFRHDDEMWVLRDTDSTGVVFFSVKTSTNNKTIPPQKGWVFGTSGFGARSLEMEYQFRT